MKNVLQSDTRQKLRRCNTRQRGDTYSYGKQNADRDFNVQHFDGYTACL